MRRIDYSRGGYDNATERFMSCIETTKECIVDNPSEKQDADVIANAVADICRVINHNSSENAAQYINLAMAQEHRTLQAQTVHALLRFFDLYQDTSYDLRNAAAVDAAQAIAETVKQESLRIPLI